MENVTTDVVEVAKKLELEVDPEDVLESLQSPMWSPPCTWVLSLLFLKSESVSEPFGKSLKRYIVCTLFLF